jgi:tetratricopeptide (TPR) repeat protein
MGEVWKAQDTRLDRVVALKFVTEPAGGGAGSLDALRAEARHAAVLNHPNICTIHGFEEQDGLRFLVMEYVAGGPLSRALGGGPLPASRVLAIGTQAASALAAAHEAGIVHRDLKPANFLLTTDGLVKLTDFGIARAVHGETRTPRGRPSPTGTLEYLSPEQARGDAVDTRSDLFSLGVVLYELATDRLPFTGETPEAVLEAVLHRAPFPPRDLNPRLPRGLEHVILRALEKDPGRRWPSAPEMLDALRQVERAEAARARRLSRARGGLLVAAALVVATAGWRAWTRPAAAPARRDLVVVADLDNATGEAVFDGGLREALRSQLGESRTIEVASAERVRAALLRSGRAPDTPLDRAMAREVCQRLGGKAVVTGSIRSVGARYLVGLDATGCADGESLGSGYGEAAGKEQVLGMLGTAVSQVRSRLGESLGSMRTVAAPAEATTPSLEALRAYSLALAAKTRGDDALPLLQRALELDPGFPLAWLTVAQVRFNRGQEAKAEQAISRAYGLRARASERERLMIETVYHQLATGDSEKAIAAGTLAAQLYPADAAARRAAFLPYCMAGDLGPAREIALRETSLAPDEGVTYFNVAILHLAEGRAAEAGAVLDAAGARGVSSELFPFARRLASVLEGNPAEIERVFAPAAGQPLDARTAALQAQTAGYLGQLSRALELAQTAEAHEETREVAAVVHSALALMEALFGRAPEARGRARSALRLASGQRVVANAARARARRRARGGRDRARRPCEPLPRRHSGPALLDAGGPGRDRSRARRRPRGLGRERELGRERAGLGRVRPGEQRAGARASRRGRCAVPGRGGIAKRALRLGRVLRGGHGLSGGPGWRRASPRPGRTGAGRPRGVRGFPGALVTGRPGHSPAARGEEGARGARPWDGEARAFPVRLGEEGGMRGR